MFTQKRKKNLIKFGVIFLVGIVVIGAVLISLSIRNTKPLPKPHKVIKYVKVSIPEGFTVRQIANRFEKNKLCKSEDFISASNKIITKYKFEKYIVKGRIPKYEGYFFPATYDIPEKSIPKVIAEMMFKALDKRFTPAMYDRCKSMGMTPDEVITLASIVQVEGAKIVDFPKIAGVFINRLQMKTKLQSDATINYYVNTLKDKTKIQDVKFTEIETPYNTYLFNGLTPGPISNPGMDAINAVLHYEKNDYLFFYGDISTGKTYYAKTFSEHETNRLKYGPAR
ncbi:MAG: endolytic transglycosylase MltG [Bacillota bacterium]